MTLIAHHWLAVLIVLLIVILAARFLLACDEDRYRILSQSVRSGRSPVVGGRLVVRYRPSRLIVGWPSGVTRAGHSGGGYAASATGSGAWLKHGYQR